MPIHLSTLGGISLPMRRDRLVDIAQRMVVGLGLPRAEVSLLVCDDATIHALNRDHRHKDKPTDVLAFAMREGEGAEFAGDLLGDVVISVDTARRQARERGHGVGDEIRFLLAHGLLHLVGFDHPDEGSLRRMLALGDALVAASRNNSSVRPPRDRRRIRR